MDPRVQSSLSSRRDLLQVAVAASGLALLPGIQAASAEEITTKSGVSIPYTVVKKGPSGGGKPKVGDLVAIRFKGAVKATGSVFDDILASPDPYYTRLGRFGIRIHACALKPRNVILFARPSTFIE